MAALMAMALDLFILATSMETWMLDFAIGGDVNITILDGSRQ